MNKIYHISENVSFESGGVRTILLLLHKYLIENEFDSKIITNHREISDDFIEFKSESLWSYNKEIKPFLANIDRKNIFHLHGVYSYTQYISSKIAIKNNIPYLVTPHGMLEPWIIKKNKLKKNLYLRLILNKVLKNAKVLHAITPLEKQNLYNLTKHKNIVEIPNLILFNTIPTNVPCIIEEDYFIFIGRIDKKKGIELLIEVFNSLKNNTVKLKILGPENEYSLYLKSLVKKLHLEDKIEFLGGIYGNEKYDLIVKSRALIAPSYSEAIGMVNLEAAACKTPVITTFQTGLLPEWNSNGGKLINPNFEELKSAILESLSWTKLERMERGKSLYNFVFKNYSWEKKGVLWKEVYTTL